MTRVAYIGNFKHEFCTESHVAWAFEQLGCTVMRVQQEDANDRHHPIEMFEPDLVLYTRTHNATALGPVWTDEWERLGKREIVTASLHLDRFWDLDRERLIHEPDPLFTTQHVFTADGGNQQRFEAAGVNHHWLPPAVHAPGCYDVAKKDRTVPPVVFIGSDGQHYHREYPQRGELLAFLRDRYGNRFAHYGVGGRPNVRGEQLNRVVQSAQVVVGDSCFANSPSAYPDPHRMMLFAYWSDRIPETLGRGGCCVHPQVVGLADQYDYQTELVVHAPGTFGHLGRMIDELLEDPDQIRLRQRAGRARVLAEHTYTHRAAELLHTVGLRDTATIEVPA